MKSVALRSTTMRLLPPSTMSCNCFRSVDAAAMFSRPVGWITVTFDAIVRVVKLAITLLFARRGSAPPNWQQARQRLT
jgi:hypothetical protein